MADLEVFPDIEIVARQALLDLCNNVATKTPSDTAGSLSWLPFVRVQCRGGDDDRITDNPHLAVDCFASTKTAASLLARKVQQRFISGALHVPGMGVIDVGITLSRPQYVPWTDSPPPYRYTAMYSLDQRRFT